MSTKIGSEIFHKTAAIKEQEQVISDKISGGRKEIAKEETEFLFARGREQREKRKVIGMDKDIEKILTGYPIKKDYRYLPTVEVPEFLFPIITKKIEAAEKQREKYESTYLIVEKEYKDVQKVREQSIKDYEQSITKLQNIKDSPILEFYKPKTFLGKKLKESVQILELPIKSIPGAKMLNQFLNRLVNLFLNYLILLCL